MNPTGETLASGHGQVSDRFPGLSLEAAAVLGLRLPGVLRELLGPSKKIGYAL